MKKIRIKYKARDGSSGTTLCPYPNKDTMFSPRVYGVICCRCSYYVGKVFKEDSILCNKNEIDNMTQRFLLTEKRNVI